MKGIMWVLMAVILLGLIYFVFHYKKKKGLPTNYRAMFIIGLVSIPLGISSENYSFMAMGIVFMVLGLKHRNTWKETSVKWSELTSAGKMVRSALIAAAILLLAGMLIYNKTST